MTLADAEGSAVRPKCPRSATDAFARPAPKASVDTPGPEGRHTLAQDGLGGVSKEGTSPGGTAESLVVEGRGKGRLESPHRRVYDFNLWSERKPMEKLGYMHRNPVNCGLVAEPEH